MATGQKALGDHCLATTGSSPEALILLARWAFPLDQVEVVVPGGPHTASPPRVSCTSHPLTISPAAPCPTLLVDTTLSSPSAAVPFPHSPPQLHGSVQVFWPSLVKLQAMQTRLFPLFRLAMFFSVHPHARLDSHLRRTTHVHRWVVQISCPQPAVHNQQSKICIHPSIHTQSIRRPSSIAITRHPNIHQGQSVAIYSSSERWNGYSVHAVAKHDDHWFTSQR